jgi:hypothetical protein
MEKHPYCGSTKVVVVNGELVCTNCATVLRPEYVPPVSVLALSAFFPNFVMTMSFCQKFLVWEIRRVRRGCGGGAAPGA